LPRPCPLREAQPDELRALLARRRPLIARRPAAQNRLEHVRGRVRPAIEAPIAWLEQRVAARDADVDTTRRASPVWREREPLSRRVPGMGPGWARTGGFDLPELGP
jgi:hypothetical protein